MAYLCKYCYQKFDSKKLMVLRNCSKSPTGKHVPAGSLIKGTYILGVVIGIVVGIAELAKRFDIHQKIMLVLNQVWEKMGMFIENIKNIIS